MEQITYVKLSHDEIIDITIPPKKDCHYEIDDDILWVIPDYQTSRAKFMRIVTAGVIIAQGVNEKEVDIIMPPEFQQYRRWAALNGYKKHNAKTLATYMKHFFVRV